MNLPKAIEILTIETYQSPVDTKSDLVASLRLGIEALKDIQASRILGILDPAHKLLGETEL